MSPMRIIILLLALVAAGGAALLVTRMSQPQIITETLTATETLIQPREVSEIKVLTARRDFNIGEEVTADDLRWSVWPESGVAEGQFTEKATPDAMDQVAGAIVRMPIYANEPIMPQRLVKRGEAGLLPVLMEPGMRAVSVEISAESASGGFILPNDRVDLILTYDQRADASNGLVSDRKVATTVLQNVRVLAIDQSFTTLTEEGESARIGHTATLELTPQEAELVSLSRRMGTMDLALRPLDEETVQSPRSPRYEVMEGGGGAGITIIRNSQPMAAAALGGN